MSTAREIYNTAVREAREAHQASVERFIAGDLDVCPGGMDMEREAIVAAFAKALGETP